MSAKVSFRITTYWKRPRGESGLTRMGSHRMDIGRAIGWLVAELPDDSYEMRFDGADADGSAAKTTIVIDWTKVPADIKDSL